MESLNIKQTMLSRLLSEKRDEIFHAKPDYNFVALVEEQKDKKRCLYYFKTKESLINLLKTKQVFACESRSNSNMILMF